jgi:signal transduction histidine kinase
LNVIIGYAEMLRDGELGAVSAEQAAALDRTHRQAVVLLEMITALLDLNRLEAGRLPISRVPVDVPELLTELIEQLPPAWRVHDVAVRVDSTPGIATLLTDRGKLKTVLRNLVHNALKFTSAGEVVVAAAPTADGVAFTVRDTGVGIPEEALPYVFEMFRQVPGTGGGGVGLGLHIVRRFVDALGGTVEVTSTVGVGTTFVVTLAAGPERRAAEKAGRPKTVLGPGRERVAGVGSGGCRGRLPGGCGTRGFREAALTVCAGVAQGRRWHSRRLLRTSTRRSRRTSSRHAG